MLRAQKFREAHPTLANRRELEARSGRKAPVRPSPILARFVKEHFEKVKGELSKATPNAKVKPTDVLKELTRQFHAISPEVRTKAEEAYQKDFARYTKELEAFNAAGPPKRPATAYIVRRARSTHGSSPRVTGTCVLLC